MQQDELKPPSIFSTLGVIRGVAQIVCHAYACVMYSLLRRRFGVYFFSLWELLGVFAPLAVLVVLGPHGGPSYLPYLMNLYLGLMGWHRFCAGGRRRIATHSRYNGYPRLCTLFPVSERAAKVYVEPLASAVAGFVILLHDFPLGVFLIVGAFALVLEQSHLDYELDLKVRRVTDAEIDDDVLMEEFESRRNWNE